MEKDSEKIKEPFKPEDTPKPPQIIDPDDRNERRHPVKEEEKPASKQPREQGGK